MYGEIGKRVRAMREMVGLTQQGLAEAAGLHRTYIGAVERGETNPTASTLVGIAQALGKNPGRLLDRLELDDTDRQ